MAMIINDNTASVSTLNYYHRSTDSMQKSMMHIVSGMKIRSAAEDPTNWAINERMRERIRALDQASQNVQNDTSLLKTAEGAISNTVEIIHTLKARAINSANDHNDVEERAVLQREAQQLLWQIDNNANTTTYNGKKLLDGSQANEGLTFHIGGEANFSVTFKLGDMSVNALGLSGLDLSTRENAVSALGVRNSDGTYSDYVIDPATGKKTYGMLDTALNKALDMQASIGAMEERLGYTSETLTNSSENLQGSASTLIDSDIAKEMASYIKWNILSQATQHMLAQQNQNAASVVDLLAPVR